MWFMVKITIYCENEMKNNYKHCLGKMQICMNGNVGGNI